MTSTPMIDPASALLAFGGVVALLAAILWPRRGVAARLARLASQTARVQAEDALKHVFHCEGAGAAATIDSLAGALHISRASGVGIVTDLAARELLRLGDGGGLALTEAGRGYAVHIVRSHRLWERYLADRTGVAPGEWHAEADVVEHSLSPAEADRLSARMGYPLFDPHGAPIPTATGETPAREGIALSSLAPGEAATITHVEDEPEEVFGRLVAAGLGPGVRVRVRERTPAEIAVEAGGRAHRLPPVVAANVTVLRSAEPLEPDAGPTLAAVRPGEEARVTGLSAACTGPQRRRLLDLGFVPGTPIAAEMASALGDPIAYRIRETLIALRPEQASWVRVEPVPPARAAP